jgi:hypothetical protein
MSWTHLIRFEHNGEVYYGDAVFPDGSNPTNVVALASMGALKARIIEGGPFSDTPTNQENLVVMDKLLSPLTRTQVPIIRCIGLNYKKHSNLSLSSLGANKLIRCSQRGRSNSTALSITFYQTFYVTYGLRCGNIHS